MPSTPPKFALTLALLVTACLCLGGCRLAQWQARRAYSDYELAVAANDMPSARKALLKLVDVQDNVPDYWVELGKIQASTGDYGAAQYAFTRAYELDRRDVDVLRALTQLNLRGGYFPTAQIHARELELLAPSDPWIKLADGYVALSESRFDKALAISDALLAAAPFDSNGTVLKARTLLSLSKLDEALALLDAQIAAQPSDVGALQLLEKIYEQRNDWSHVAQTARRLNLLIPGRTEGDLVLIAAALRSGSASEAREASLRVLQPAADPAIIASVLDLWAEFWPSFQRVKDARALGHAARGVPQKLAYAAFLNRVDDPAGALDLIGLSPDLPMTADNVEANAVLADAFGRSRKDVAAGQLFDAVLSYDSGNPIALRGRAELRLRTGQAKAAIPDAQKLVSILTKSARDRLLLARCYRAAGDPQQAERTLWDGFHDIPSSEPLFTILKTGREGNAVAIASLTEEYTQRRNAELYRGIL